MWTSILIGVFLIVFTYWFYSNTKKPNNFPPGPLRLPIIGSLLSIGIPPHKGLARLHKKYGNIFGIYCGNYPAIVLNDLTLIRDAFGDDRFSARPPLRPILERGRGIIFGSGKKWLEQRKFIVKVFREFGFGKSDTHEIIKEEVLAVVQEFKKTQGKPTPVLHHFHTAIINVLWTIAAGVRFNYDDEELQHIVKMTSGVLRFRSLDSASIVPQLLFFQPWLTKLFPVPTGWNALNESLNMISPILKKYIKSHKDSFDPNNIRDLIDVYLEKIYSVTDKDSPFYKENGERGLLELLLDLFVAGGETASSNLSWGILYLSCNENYQERLHEEIDSVIGSRLPSIRDRRKMPLMEACINETLRLAMIGALSIVHSTSENIPNFHGYTLPKDTIVYGNFWQVNHDKDCWGDPEKFRPERFLGGGTSKVSRSNVFSKGKRVCPGEGLARDELFLFLTGVLQEFVFKRDANCPIPCFDPTLAATLRTVPYEVIILPRDKKC